MFRLQYVESVSSLTKKRPGLFLSYRFDTFFPPLAIGSFRAQFYSGWYENYEEHSTNRRAIFRRLPDAEYSDKATNWRKQKSRAGVGSWWRIC